MEHETKLDLIDRYRDLLRFSSDLNLVNNLIDEVYILGKQEGIRMAVDALPEEKGRKDGEDKEWAIHYLGYDECRKDTILALTSLIKE